MSDVAANPIGIGQRRPTPIVGRPISRAMRARKDRLFITVCVTATALSIVVLIALLVSVFYQGVGKLSWQFLTGGPSSDPLLAGVWPAMAGTAAICAVCAISAVPIGVMTAILLEEFKPRHWLLRRAHLLVQLNITNLAGVPSIVYGILGLTVFVHFFGVAGHGDRAGAEIGVRYFDQFSTVDGQTVRVPVANASAPVTVFAETLALQDDAGRPTTATRVDAAAVSGAIRALDRRFDALQYALEDRIDSLRTLSGTPLQTALAEQWTAAGLPGKVPAALATRVAEGVAKPGREGKKALRAAVKSVATDAAAAEFPRSVLSDAVPSRVPVYKPWYVRLPFGRSVLACGLTLMLVVLPVIIIATQESLRAVSDSIRRASLALGATKWQTVWSVTLPSALPGVMTGVILAMSRAIGEAAPVFVVVGGLVFISSAPHTLMDENTAMPLQIYSWAGLPNTEFHRLAAAGIILLLAVLLCFNLLAIWIRQRTQQKQQ